MNAAAIDGELVGRVIDGRFTLVERLGSSQGAEVFLADFGDPRQRCALKLIPADQEDAELRMRAWEAATSLSHPNLMKAFGAGRCEIDSVALFYLAEEHADEVLAEIVPQRALTPQEAREMLAPLLDALGYLHQQGFVYGRLKPSNIMAVGDRLKLSADGLTFTGEFQLPSTERTVYDAPETGQGAIGPAADIWSLGATLVEVLTQRPPVWDGTARTEPVVPETIPQPFAAIARNCLRNDPARRCTLQDIHIHLALRAKHPNTEETAHPRHEEPESESTLTRRRVAVTVGAVAALFVTFAIWRAQSHREEAPAPAAETQNTPPAALAAQNPPPAPATPSDASSAPASGSASSSDSPPASTSDARPVSAAPANPAPEAAPAPVASQDQPPPATNTPSGGVTVRGEVTQQAQPNVLASAMRTISGTVKVRVRVAVDAAGNVAGADLESAGPSRYFAGKALEAARHFTFKPAQIDGRPAAGTWILYFAFRRSGITVTPIETVP